MRLIKKNKKIILDIVLNITASALPVAMLQLLIYPQVAKSIGGDSYGLMLTIYSVWIMVSNSLGIVLNNIKLLNQPKYNELSEVGDIPILLRRWTIISSAIIFFCIWFYCRDFSLQHVVLGTIISVLILLKAYLEVGFRIVLAFKSILINNALLSLGFYLGFLLFKLSGIWEWIFLIGYGLSCFYCSRKTKLLEEPLKKTSLYPQVKKDSYSLVVAAVISNLINYADKLVLYPLMGGTIVSIYYTATILGKITGMLTGPINSVILSYITRWDNTKANVFTKVVILSAGIVSVGYFVTIAIARPVINLLFPQWVDDVMNIIPLTTVTIMLNIMSTILQPFVLKYCKMHWQIIINGIGSLTYFGMALVLWRYWGIKGFCIGTIVGVAVKLILMISVYYRSKEYSETLE